MSEWISVEERLPEMKEMYKSGPLTSGRVLVALKGGAVDIGTLSETYTHRRRWQCEFWRQMFMVTHWQPMPEPPK